MLRVVAFDVQNPASRKSATAGVRQESLQTIAGFYVNVEMQESLQNIADVYVNAEIRKANENMLQALSVVYFSVDFALPTCRQPCSQLSGGKERERGKKTGGKGSEEGKTESVSP